MSADSIREGQVRAGYGIRVAPGLVERCRNIRTAQGGLQLRRRRGARFALIRVNLTQLRGFGSDFENLGAFKCLMRNELGAPKWAKTAVVPTDPIVACGRASNFARFSCATDFFAHKPPCSADLRGSARGISIA